MHLPFTGKELIYRFTGKEIRRTVWTVQHPDIPGFAIGRDQIRSNGLRLADRRWRGAGSKRRAGDGQQIRHFQSPPGVPAELAQCEG